MSQNVQPITSPISAAAIQQNDQNIDNDLQATKQTVSNNTASINSQQASINTANTNATNAVNTANSAVSTANTANTTANTALTNANNATTTANQAVSTATSAQSAANNAVTTANAAQTTATSAATTANTTQTNLTNHTSSSAAHPASAITETGNGDVQTALNSVRTQLANIVSGGTSVTEVVNARTSGPNNQTFTSLQQRLDFHANMVNILDTLVAQGIQSTVNSGVQLISAITANQTSTPNAFIVGKEQPIVNGRELMLTNVGGKTDGTNLIQLDAPPSTNVTPSLVGSARDDLMFLEMWKAWVPVGGNIYPNGWVGGTPTVATYAQYQWQWRIRVVDGVDFATYTMDGFTTVAPGWSGVNRIITAQGGNATPIAQNTNTSTNISGAFIPAMYSSGFVMNFPNVADTGLYIAGTGDSTSQTKLATADGYVYAIPLFRVRRRNSTAYDPDTNPLGGAQYATANSSSTGAMDTTQSVAADGTSTIKVGDTLTIPFTAVPSTWSVGNILYRQASSLLIGKITSISGNTVTVQSYNYGATSLNNQTFYTGSDRPDGLYSNIIDASDIVDLRHQVSLTGFNYQALLEKNLDLLLRGQLNTNATTRYGRDYIGLNVSGTMPDDANTLLRVTFDGASMAGTANGAAVTNTKQGSGTEAYANGVQGLAADFTGGTYCEQYQLPATLGTTGSIEVAFKMPKTALSTSGGFVSGYGGSDGTTRRFLFYVSNSGGVQFSTWTDANGNGNSLTATLPFTWGDPTWHTAKVTWNPSGMSIYIDGVQIGTTSNPPSFSTVNYVVVGSGSSGGSGLTTYPYTGQIDSVRVSNIVRSGTPLPSTYSYANGDRILDGPGGDFTTWSDDIGGTAGVNGRTNPYGLSRVPNQIAARVSYNGSEIRHYYGQGITPGFSSVSSVGTNPTGAFDNSGEYVTVTANESADGTRTTFTFNQPSNAQGLYLSTGVNSSLVGNPTLSSISIDGTGKLTAIYATAPANGASVQAYYRTGARHAHFIPSTKGFIIHDWTDDTLTGDGTTTVFWTTKYNVTSINHLRVNGAIQNGGYSTTGIGVGTYLTASAAQGATSIQVNANPGSGFVTGQTIRISDGKGGGWVTTTVGSASVSGSAGAYIIPVSALPSAVSSGATVQGNAKVTFTTAPASGATVDLVYESIVTPSVGDYLRLAYQHIPYAGLLGTPFAGSGKYQFLYVPTNGGFVTTLGSGSNATPSVPGWAKDYPVPSAMLPINGYDYTLKKDTITPVGTTATSASQQLVMNEQVYEQNNSSAANIYSPLTSSTPNTQTSRGYSGLSLNDGVSGRGMAMSLRDLSSAIPHLVGLVLIAQDAASGELMMYVVTSVKTDATNLISAGLAVDVFKLQGRPLCRSYAGVTA